MDDLGVPPFQETSINQWAIFQTYVTNFRRVLQFLGAMFPGFNDSIFGTLHWKHPAPRPHFTQRLAAKFCVAGIQPFFGVCSQFVSTSSGKWVIQSIQSHKTHRECTMIERPRTTRTSARENLEIRPRVIMPNPAIWHFQVVFPPFPVIVVLTNHQFKIV